LFIPVIPLGRKRIVDYCPACTRHYVMDMDKWDSARQLEISGAMEKYRANPTVETAIGVHRQLLEFHQLPQAAEFRQLMVTQFPDNAKLFAYLGAAHAHLGQLNEAAEFYNKALALRPDLPEARIGVAKSYIRGNRLDEARTLLDFLEKPGAAQLYSLEPLEILARAYQSAGKHQPALELFGRIIAELPKVLEHAGFRKAVKTSEKALGRTASILPTQKFSFKRLFAGAGTGGGQTVANTRALIILGVVFALVVLGFMISNEYTRRHRKLYLVNAYSAPATVEIQGAGTVKNFRGVHTLDLPEGHFHVVITGPRPQQLDIDVRDTYFNRTFGDALWLINVGGGALLEEVTATYKRNPEPATITYHAGKTFEHFHKVTHPFQTLPDTVSVESGGSKTLIGLDLYPGEAGDVFDFYLGKRDNSAALEFGENWLRAHPEDDSVLLLYATAAGNLDTNRLEKFLLAGLTNRPIQIQWHRQYQDLFKRGRDESVLLAKYDDLLRADPTNSALLYLRGRLDTNRETARTYYNRSLTSDPKNPFPYYALGLDRAAAGDWAGARPLVAKAAELNPRDITFENMLYLCRLATGDAPAIETESRNTLARDPVNYDAELRLLDALAAQDKSAEAAKACDDFVAKGRSQYGARGADVTRAIQYHAYYAIGDFTQLKSLAEKDTSVSGRVRLVTALIELGQVEEAATIISGTPNLKESETIMFGLSVASRLKGNEAEAAKWEARGIELIKGGRFDSAVTAALLTRGTPPTRAEAENLILAPQNKAIVLTMLAQKYPQAHVELAALARQLNVRRDFPYYLVRRATTPAP
jgi:tetratricopeptide (TPR) repeat protein